MSIPLCGCLCMCCTGADTGLSFCISPPQPILLHSILPWPLRTGWQSQIYQGFAWTLVPLLFGFEPLVALPVGGVGWGAMGMIYWLSVRGPCALTVWIIESQYFCFPNLNCLVVINCPYGTVRTPRGIKLRKLLRKKYSLDLQYQTKEIFTGQVSRGSTFGFLGSFPASSWTVCCLPIAPLPGGLPLPNQSVC